MLSQAIVVIRTAGGIGETIEMIGINIRSELVGIVANIPAVLTRYIVNFIH